MAKKIRFLLFVWFSVLFLVITPLVVFHARGYQFNFEEKKLVQTGGIFLKSTSPKAHIYLNNKLLKVQTPAALEGLTPGEYLIKLELNNFHSWQKKIKVKSSLVNKQENILLLPKNPEIIPITKIPKLPTPNSKLFYNSHEIYYNKKLVTRYAQKIKQAFLYKDQKHIIFLVGNQVKFIELDGQNIADFIKADKINYDAEKNILYLISLTTAARVELF